MNHTCNLRRSRWLPVIWSLLTVISCQKSNETGPVSSCKLTHQSYSQTGPQGTYSNETQYNFDANGQFVGQISQSVNTPKTGNRVNSNSRQTLVYDARGFLTGQSNLNESTELGKTTAQSYTVSYDYVNDRLVKESRRDIGTTGEVSNYITQYEYDGNGKLAKMTIDSRGTLYIQTFTNGLLTKYLVRAPNGTETQPATINSQGLITKYVRGSTSYDTYEYDAKQQIVREENWFNNKLNSYRLNEYDNKKSVFGSISPVFKGHPQVVTNGKRENNATRYTIYSLDNSGVMKKQSDYVYTYSYTAKGYPLEYALVDGVTGLTAKVTYTISDCD